MLTICLVVGGPAFFADDIYIRDYAPLSALTRGLEAYFCFHNHERHHQSLDYAVPAAVHFAVKEQVLDAC